MKNRFFTEHFHTIVSYSGSASMDTLWTPHSHTHARVHSAWAPLLLATLTLSVSTACENASSPPGVSYTPIGEGYPVEHPSVDVPAISGETRRMTVDQLQASLTILAGQDLSGKPIQWTVMGRNAPVDALSDSGLGRTLGRPDYVAVTDEPAQPSTLYVKFMDDMARDVCPKMMTADYGRSNASARNFLPLTALDNIDDAASINRNLRYLVLKFFGEKVSDDASVADLKAVFDATVAESEGDATTRSRVGWNSVCVALFLSPALHIY